MKADSSIEQHLRTLVDRFRSARDLKTWISLDIEFHRTLLESSGLQPLVAFGDLLHIFFQRFRESVKKAEWKVGVESHQRIVDQLADCDFAEAIHSRHRAQTTHYLLLFGLHHAKIINMRPESVEHEFINILASLTELRNPKIVDASLLPDSPGAQHLLEILLSLVHDWGAGLDLALDEEALTHFLGGESTVLCKVPVIGTGGELAQQKMRLFAPDTAFKLTAFQPDSPSHLKFRTHAHRLLNHTPLNFIQWINIHQTEITFDTIQRIQN